MSDYSNESGDYKHDASCPALYHFPVGYGIIASGIRISHDTLRGIALCPRQSRIR